MRKSQIEKVINNLLKAEPRSTWDEILLEAETVEEAGIWLKGAIEREIEDLEEEGAVEEAAIFKEQLALLEE